MTSKLIVALAAIAVQIVVCNGDKNVFSTSVDDGVTLDAGDIMWKLRGFDGELPNQQVFDFLSALPPTFKLNSWYTASDYAKLATLRYSSCIGYDFDNYAYLAQASVSFEPLWNYSEFCRLEFINFCKSNTNKVIEEFYINNNAGKRVVANVGKYIDEFERVCRSEHDNRQADLVEGHCREIVSVVDEGLVTLEIDPKEVVAHLSETTKLPVDKYVERCRAFIRK